MCSCPSILMSYSPADNCHSDNPQVEIFKSFRVAINDPCEVVLPVVSIYLQAQTNPRCTCTSYGALRKSRLTDLSSPGAQTLQHPRRLAAVRPLHRPRRPRALPRPQGKALTPLQTTRQGRPETDVHVTTPRQSAGWLERCCRRWRRWPRSCGCEWR